MSNRCGTLVAAAVLTLSMVGISSRAEAQTQIKPYIMILLDTSSSMLLTPCASGDACLWETYGDGSNSTTRAGWGDCCSGRDMGTGTPPTAWDTDTDPDDSRLYIAKQAIHDVVSAYGDVTFGLMRYYAQECAAPFMCYGDSLSEVIFPAYMDNMNTGLGASYNTGDAWGSPPYIDENSELDLINYLGFASRVDCSWPWYSDCRCTPLATAGGDVLVGFYEDNQNAIVEWIDGTEGYNGIPGPGGTATLITNNEIRATGFTPLARAVDAADTYMVPIRNADSLRDCRAHILVIITDGEDTCDGNPVTSINTLYGDGIQSYTIGFAFSSTTLDNMADRGDDGSLNGSAVAFNASNEAELSAAFQTIIENTVLVEICDGDDDDCDTLIDEGFTLYCDLPSHPAQDLCVDPGETLCNGIDDNCDGSVDEGLLNACGTCGTLVEICNGIDDDCDGLADEGGVCGTCVPTGEICDNLDNDCDTIADDNLTRSCGTDVGICTAGTQTCTSGVWGSCVGEIPPGVETCNNLDDDCNGVIDGFSRSCGIDTGECEFGFEICSAGAWGTCQGDVGPTAEVCNNLDDNCDTFTDEGNPGGGTSCGTDTGECVAGTTQCIGGSLVCVGEVPPGVEVCNGDDDDCDGVADDGNPGGGAVCGPIGLDGHGVCQTGLETCTGGSVICVGAVWDSAEVCNGLDDDCDDTPDDGNPEGGAVCGTDTGECEAGVTNCTGGALVCQGEVGATTEVCNNLDDDCDGTADDGNPGGGAVCGTDTGECVAGVLTCLGGGLVCFGETPAVAEVCNTLDDDCDGTADEGNPGGGAACGPIALDGIGICEAGIETCTAGSIVCTGAVYDTAEVCNGLDDDCNTFADDGDPGGGGACGTDTGECEAGIEHCVGGTIACIGEVGPGFEICDGLDNDCDGVDDNGNPGGGAVCGTVVGECDTGILTCLSGSLTCAGETSPVAELCDGLDNDCDGDLDEGNPEGGGLCGPVAFDGIGICQAGVYQCVTAGPGSASLDCVGAVYPEASETCNGLDDDCNGTADDGDPGGGATCGNDTGECVAGTEHCVGGVVTCVGAVGPGTEICDGLDNNCDGDIDEGDPGGGAACGIDVGECRSGTVHCMGGGLVCDGEIPPTTELCNGLDDDCDTIIDDGNPEGGVLCGPVTLDGIGICEAGVQTCVTAGPGSATVECLGAVYPDTIEDCNGLDDDCNGLIDDGIVGGADCGTDEGECVMGHRECFSGVWVCVGEIGPTDELCDGLDNNCDGVLDEGNPEGGAVCGTDIGECEPGITYCDLTLTPPDIVCMGEVGPADEVCDGLDNDCNHLVDDGLPLGEECGTDEGECSMGNYICLDGEIVCAYGIGPSAEVCDGLDNDCDGVADNEAECPGDSICVEGYCASPCDPSDEWPCPSGKVCDEVDGEDGTFCIGDPCDGVECEDDERCQGGFCVSLCDMVTCPPGQVCIIEDGMPVCIPADCYAEGWECDDGERCVAGECEPDPCWDVVCGTEQFCREGECFDACTEDIVCPDGEECYDGVCVVDLCWDVECSFGFVCDPETGNCIEDDCGGVSCREPLICVDGECIDDPCYYIECPDDHTCVDGTCVDDDMIVEPEPDDPADADTDPEAPVQIAATGYGGCVGCTMTSETGADGAWVLGLLMGVLGLALGFGRRLRRSSRTLLITGALAGSLFALGCDTTPYCLTNCDEEDATSDTDDDGTADTFTDVEMDTADVILDTNYDIPEVCNPLAEELCNGVDDDCDDEIDEGFDLDNDPNNCGECGNRCELPHAYVGCIEGECVIDPERGCDVNFYDCVEDDPTDPETMGCDTYCIQTRDDDAYCDGYDNDCDCEIDEDIDLTTDVDNCGVCGRRCRYFNAEPGCESETGLAEDAECFLFDCIDGYHDLDEDPDNGCEYECSTCTNTEGSCVAGETCCTAGGDETCNGLDDNCDGEIDEGDPGGGVACGSDVGECSLGTLECVDGALVCQGDTRPVQEECDGLDNDCDGTSDEPDLGETELPDEGVACGSSMGDCERGLTVCVSGALDCQGDVEPIAEICDGHDNDCNGSIDDGTIPGLGDPCGSGAGECVEGTMTCVAGIPVCVGEVEPASEICDGLDNDCNGTADDGIPGAGAICGTDTGQCNTGAMQCISGTWVCDGETPPTAELCNGFDDDCDGLDDEGDPEGGTPCGTSVGECIAGNEHCVGGTLVCQGDTGPGVETCNGLDDDCNGTADDGTIPGMGDPCGSNTGECVAGVLQCIGGVEVCVGEVTPATEICDTLDNDCDGTADNAVPGVGTVCGFDTGECVEGTMQCIAGSLTCQGATGPTAEICDGLDNDCDGTADDGDPGGGASCGNGTGECIAGTEHCDSGSIVCQGAVPGSAEICDGLDNDCDGTVDNGNPGGGAVCGTNTGECNTGIEQCLVGSIVCVGETTPTSEICDGFDNDCDGTADNGVPGEGSPCGSDVGTCVAGTMQCVSASMECVGDVGPTAEICDTFDNDCDGTADDGNPGGGASCGTSVGECSAGVQFCIGGTIQCQGAVGSSPEVCDGLDNDCDGTADNGNPGSGGTCGTDVGDCVAGTENCIGGTIVCTGDTGPSPEVCDDGGDEDCDGFVDEDWLKDIDPLNCGTCGHDCATEVSPNAIYTCSGGSCVVVGCDLDWWPGPDQGCTSGPSCCTYNCTYTGDEICDGIDNDCDGDIDTADISLVGVSNYCVQFGECNGAAPVCTSCGGSTGWYCTYGATTTVGADCVSLDPESGLCDDLDNDCDGEVDEHFPLKGTGCSDGIGECYDTGAYVCTGDDLGIECNASATGGSAETCDGLDNDCNGTVDDFAYNDWSTIGAVLINGDRVFQYEASRPNAGSCDPGTETYTGGVLESKPCSKTGVQPWTNISWTDARQACQNLGGSWDLCDAPYWQNTCETASNYLFPYGNSYQANTCNGNDYDTNCPCGAPCTTGGDNDEILDTGSLPACTSNWSGTDVYDMSGNVKEWTNSSLIVDTDGDTTPDTTYYEIRGGSSNVPAGGLTCQFDFTLGRSTFTFFNLGFRCCHP